MKNIITLIAENHVFANTVFLMMIAAGIIAATQMVKEDLPVMAEDMIEVSVVWEGADPTSVEEGILRKIEIFNPSKYDRNPFRFPVNEAEPETTIVGLYHTFYNMILAKKHSNK